MYYQWVLYAWSNSQAYLAVEIYACLLVHKLLSKIIVDCTVQFSIATSIVVSPQSMCRIVTIVGYNFGSIELIYIKPQLLICENKNHLHGLVWHLTWYERG